MNEKKYITYLERYHQWLIAHKEKATEKLALQIANESINKLGLVPVSL